MVPKLMLAATARSVAEVYASDPKALWIVSEKLDGIRAIVHEGKLLSRTLKPFPNKSLNDRAAELIKRSYLMEGDELELVGRGTGGRLRCEQTQSIVMARDKLWDGTYNIFGSYGKPAAYAQDRCWYASEAQPIPCSMLTQESAEFLYDAVVSKGGEGLMLRKYKQTYKHGRSTLKEGALVKVKPSLDGEFEVVGFAQEMSKGGDPKPSLGALICITPGGAGFHVGSGFTREQRETLWHKRDTLQDQSVNISFPELFPATGIPRFPVFNFFREAS